MEKTLHLLAIKTKSALYVSEKPGSRGNTSLTSYLVDGKKPKASFHKNWIVLDKPPKKIEREVSQPNINHRFVLKDPSLSDKFQEIYQREDVAVLGESDYGYSNVWRWKPEFEGIEYLYKEVSDSQPNTKTSVEFEFSIILELDEIKEHGGFSYKAQKFCEHEGTFLITEKDAKNQLIDEIIFPEPVLPMKPTRFTSKQTYDIVRQYIKENINPQIAEITSDYDFCFKVKKRIPFSEPEKYTVDVNFDPFSKRKKQPKYETRYRRERLVEIFEMTSAPRNYKGYTPIKGFQGKNHTDLKEKIDFYLEALMGFINKPIKDCPHCHGNGVVLDLVAPPQTKAGKQGE
jgi:hypothetical protein